MSTFDERTQLSVPHFRWSKHSVSSSHLPSNCPQGSASEQHKSRLYGFKLLHPGPGPKICIYSVLIPKSLQTAIENKLYFLLTGLLSRNS